MKGDAKLIEYLNHALKNELTATNQYLLHAKMYRDWGYHKLAEKEHAESADELKHADTLIERILFLEGYPDLQHLGKLLIGKHPHEMLKCDLKLETTEAIPLLREAISFAESINDYVTRDILVNILNSEEEHVDWLESQLYLIDKLGVESYLENQL